MDTPSAKGDVPSQEMAELLEEVENLLTLKRGQIVQGLVVTVDQGEILVNIGHKSEGVIPQREMRTLSPKELEELRVGDEVLTYVVQPAGGDGEVILSLDRARGEEAWHILQQHLENGQPIEARIVGFNRGGAIVYMQGVQGFVPLSQLAPMPRASGDSQEVLAKRVDEQVHLQVLEVDRERGRVLFSERAILRKAQEAQKEQLLSELQEGDVRRGRVSGISSFGAFVDLGGADGLVHISEMSWEPIGSPSDVVQIGDEIDVYVLRVDQSSRRIALSLRKLSPEPWQTIGERYHVGQMVTGTVTKLVHFGAFARIESGVEGLIHISELSERAIHYPKEVVREGDELTLRILSLDPEKRRLGLSLKQADLL